MARRSSGRLRVRPARDGWWTCYDVVAGPLPTPCWVWRGATDSKGYAQLWTTWGGRSRVVRVHRWLKAIADRFPLTGPMGPPGFDAHHECYCRACINPAHSDWQPERENRNNLRRH